MAPRLIPAGDEDSLRGRGWVCINPVVWIGYARFGGVGEVGGASTFFFSRTEVLLARTQAARGLPGSAGDERIVYRDIPEEMKQLIEPIVQDHGLELVDVERSQSRVPWMLRVIVDTREGDGRVPVERCAEVSRELGVSLDAANAIPVAYNLEVSSPGFNRVLAREKDFSAVCGRDVKVETRAPIEGRRRFRGRLLDFEIGVARIALDGDQVAIPFADVSKAKVVYEFTREDFAGRSGR